MGPKGGEGWHQDKMADRVGRKIKQQTKHFVLTLLIVRLVEIEISPSTTLFFYVLVENRIYLPWNNSIFTHNVVSYTQLNFLPQIIGTQISFGSNAGDVVHDIASRLTAS